MRQFSLLLLLLCALTVSAQSAAPKSRFTARDVSQNKFIRHAACHGWHFRAEAGYIIGGTAPLPIPAEIRHIDSYQSGAHFGLAVKAGKTFADSRWGLLTGLRFATQGMRTEATVKTYHMEMTGDDGAEMVGVWTGPVKTRVRQHTLTLPLLATYNIGRCWQVSAGPYVQWAFDSRFDGEVYSTDERPGYFRHHDPTGERAEVTHATYDFRDDLRHFGLGVQVGADCALTQHMTLGAALNWGLTEAFHSDFTAISFAMHPIYADFHVGYLF